MDGSLYIRIRGRVQGPFEMEKLRGLARRGQFSRMHQVSTDGAQWQSASDYPELFASPVHAAAQEVTPAAEPLTPVPAAKSNGHTSSHTAAWFYTQGESQRGPVDFEALKELAAQGQLKANDAVWTEGMNNWATAESLASLADLFQNHQTVDTDSSRHDSTDHGEISHDLLRTLGDSQGWVLFIALVGYLYTLGMAAGGVLQLVSARTLGGIAVAGGLTSLLQAALVAAGSTLLLNYRSQISLARYEKTETRLDSAFRALGRVWLFSGIVLLVTLVGLGIVMIALISFASSLPGAIH